MMGLHKEDDCWELHPHKKPPGVGNTKRGKTRGRGRDRTPEPKRKAENSFYIHQKL